MLDKLPLLSLLIWLPILVGCLLLLISYRPLQTILKYFAVISSAGCLIIACVLLARFDKAIWHLQQTESFNWLPALNIKYAIGVDGFSLLLVLLTCLLTCLVLVSALGTLSRRNINQYFAAFLLLQGLGCGVFLAADALLFFIFFEAILLPMYLIIGIWGGKNRIYATLKFVLYSMVGSIALLVSLIYLLLQVKIAGMPDQNSIFSMQQLTLTIMQQRWLFCGLLLAFAIKLPMLPLHTWLPDAHVQAPTAGSVILAGIVLKVGGYGMIRFLLPIVPDACAEFANYILWGSAITVVYIGLITLVEKNLKKLIAYFSIAHMAFVVLGAFAPFGSINAIKSSSTTGILTLPSAAIGIEGAMLQMLAHGVIASGLFLAVGVLYGRVKSYQIADYSGIAASMPKFAVFFFLFALANIGLPGTCGFVGELFVLLAVIKVNFSLAVVAGVLFILSAGATLWMYKNIMFAKIKSPAMLLLPDLSAQEMFVFVVLSAIIVVFGVWPAPALDLIRCSSEHLLVSILH